ncbi:hypothetical protein CN679_05590 [Bacillus pseudomycoides]|uniref:hypothetical protein n=1 Tax=Bacillus pseudomycoides TaxID=64104 RepID=UPI000BEF9156|nr:hypothetical protein [Bacillus pseudomycoides]PEI94322.1 hypothetical protein CN679_05590 [Bacillus pseudomycoides]
MKKIACLHAHHSNIEYIERAFEVLEIELIHFVDPILSRRIESDKGFGRAQAQNKLKNQLKWIAESNIDAVLITCTNYITLIQKEEFSITKPIIKIDEPFFEMLCNVQGPQTILFTNPSTAPGTVERLNRFAQQKQKSIDIKVMIIEDTFELIMQGRKEEYDDRVSKYIYQIMKAENQIISVAQLSMVDAAKKCEKGVEERIINPLDGLAEYSLNRIKFWERDLR